MIVTDSPLWEILVPCNKLDGGEWSIEHHHVWDETVTALVGGVTILKTMKGVWSFEGRTIKEPMIAVRIACPREQIYEIATLTMAHYCQKAVMLYQASAVCLVIEDDEDDQ